MKPECLALVSFWIISGTRPPGRPHILGFGIICNHFPLPLDVPTYLVSVSARWSSPVNVQRAPCTIRLSPRRTDSPLHVCDSLSIPLGIGVVAYKRPPWAPKGPKGAEGALPPGPFRAVPVEIWSTFKNPAQRLHILGFVLFT